jgi:hypothetical protein
VNPHAGHLSLELLLQDWLGETEPQVRDAIDTHLMACDACGALFDELLALGQGVREALRTGAVTMVASADLLARLAAQGMQVREYRLSHNGSVNCTLAPQDEVLAARMEAPLQGVRRLDLVHAISLAPGVEHRAEDVPFDPAAGELVVLTSVGRTRPLPAHTSELRLLAVEDGGNRELGRYTFHHQPWSG